MAEFENDSLSASLNGAVGDNFQVTMLEDLRENSDFSDSFKTSSSLANEGMYEDSDKLSMTSREINDHIDR